MTQPEFLQPLVVPVPDRSAREAGRLVVFAPDAAAGQRRGAVVFVHGGPLPPQVQPAPHEWPLFRGYAALVAAAGFVGVVFDHSLHGSLDWAAAHGDVQRAVEATRQLVEVDRSRVVLWFFSGGAPLTAPWLAAPPAELRAVALSYPVLGPFPGFDLSPPFLPADAVSAASPPLLVVRPGREMPAIAETVTAFLATAAERGADSQVIDVPNGRHSFDILDDSDESRAAVSSSLEWVTSRL